MSAAEDVPGHLVQRSTDLRAACLIDPAGRLVAAAGAGDREAARGLAELAHELVREADAVATEPTAALEVQTGRAGVFVARDASWTLIGIASRLALPALVHYDLRQALAQIGAKP